MITSVKLGAIEETMLENIRKKTGSPNKSIALRKTLFFLGPQGNDGVI
jgi:hypothetical protein|tara:strand:- start:161 stop:304 length:144 start_codon:yes stop_codon:yes gene_type:complete